MCRVLKNSDNTWQPTAAIATLKQRAKLLADIRAFFAKSGVWEVETPSLCRTTVTAPHLHSLALSYQHETWYLQTSPEYAMKRLLAAGSGAIYQISKAFRADEHGRLHNPEFTMLEWYRPGFDHHQLMNDMDDLLQTILHCVPAQRLSYADLFQQYLRINPHQISLQDLMAIADQHQLQVIGDNLDKDDWLQLLLTHCIEPTLGFSAPVFIYDFPVSQAALAKIRHGDPPLAERFEVYVNGIELANGYHELADVDEQRHRFSQDVIKRTQANYPAVALDEYLLAALPNFPDCAGVALGIDRLMMIALQKSHLSDVMAFTAARV